MPDATDPMATRRAALRADIQRASKLVSACVAEALALAVVVPVAVHEAVAALDQWARHPRPAGR